MNYFVIEIQVLENGTVGNQVWAFNNLSEAESKYHATLSLAAVSGLPVHTVLIINEEGYTIRAQTYNKTEEYPE